MFSIQRQGSPRIFIRGLLFLSAFVFLSDKGFAVSTNDNEIGLSDQWRAILFYSPRWFQSETSVVDSKEFFISAEGQHDPVAELIATKSNFLSEEALPTTNELYRCRFPARYYFLKSAMTGFTHDPLECPWIKEYFDAINPHRVSMIFSSFYLNNPASMMGHTFLLLKRSGKSGEAHSPYLDFVLNFAANPTTENPLFYSIGGLSGSFPGTFTVAPYYLKIAEYVNFENRDLWEYELNLDESQQLALFFTMLEVGPHPINYFYMDENCSYLMLFLLDAAKPSLRLRYKLNSIVTPTDTIKIVKESGLVESMSFQPSQREVFKAAFESLSDSERKRFLELSKTSSEKISNIFKEATDLEKIHVFDAFLEYVSFKERLIAQKQPVEFKDLYLAVLKARSELKGGSPVKAKPDELLRPDLAHFNKRASVGAMVLNGPSHSQSSYGVLGFRPSFHDIESPSGGLPRGLGIEIGTTKIGLDTKKKSWSLLQFKLVEVRSINPLNFLNQTPSWLLGIKYENNPMFDNGSEQLVLNSSYMLTGGIGATFGFSQNDFLLTAMIYPELEYTPRLYTKIKGLAYFGPDLLFYWRQYLSISGFYHLGIASEDHGKKVKSRYGAALRVYDGEKLEGEFRAMRSNAVESMYLGVGYYF